MKVGDRVKIRFKYKDVKTKIIGETKAYWKVKMENRCGYLLFNKKTNFLRGADDWCLTSIRKIHEQP